MSNLRPVLAILAAAIVWAAPLRAQDQPAASPVLENPVAALTLDRLAATREHPLFSPTRRPLPPPPAEVVVAAPPPPPPPMVAPPDLALYGIIEDATGARAIVRPKEDAKVVNLRVSDEVDGWKVASIAPRQLVLSLEDRSVTFTLFDSHASAEHPRVVQHAARVLELNAAGILTARRVTKPRR
jgi:hypothetical protein